MIRKVELSHEQATTPRQWTTLDILAQLQRLILTKIIRRHQQFDTQFNWRHAPADDDDDDEYGDDDFIANMLQLNDLGLLDI